MSDTGKTEHLRGEIEKLIGYFDAESTRHKLLNRRLKSLLFFLTGGATILSSAALTFAPDHSIGLGTWLNFGVVLVTVGASVVSSIEGLRKPGDLWIHERNIFHALGDLKRKLEYELSGGGFIQVDEYFIQMQNLLAASREQWANKVDKSQQAGK